MNAKDQYNKIVKKIEQLIEEGSYEKPGDIAERVCQEAGRTPRDLASVFSFLTGQPLISSIRLHMISLKPNMASRSFATPH